MLLADMGAEVIKVEGTEGEQSRNAAPRVPGGSAYWITHNRNKKSITLNLRTGKGKEILTDLVKRSDIVVENFRPGVMAQIGFDYPRLKDIKEDTILVSVSGFGQTGPYAHRPAFDQIVQAMGGLTWLTGDPVTPPARAGVYVGDYLPGLYAAFGAVLALYHRNHTGLGQHVDVSMMDAVVSMVGIPIANYIITGFAAQRRGNRNMYSAIAPNNTYQLADGYMQINANSQEHFQRFCQALNRQDWFQDARFKSPRSREEFGDMLDALVASELSTRRVSEVVSLMDKAGVPCGPVQTIPEIANDPQVEARQMIVKLDHPEMGCIPVPGVTVKMSDSPGEVKTAPPVLGASNLEVYSDLLGYATAEIEALKSEGVI
jgi:crotonobetainyl-CoA:carnitine CoA-transferase CaiB-like acyl-CoA transferase